MQKGFADGLVAPGHCVLVMVVVVVVAMVVVVA